MPIDGQRAAAVRRAEVVEVRRQADVGRLELLQAEELVDLVEAVRRDRRVEDGRAHRPRPGAGVRPLVARAVGRMHAQRRVGILVRPVADVFEEGDAAGAEEEAIRVGGVEIEPEAVLVALRRVGLAALIEVAARLLPVLDEVLVRLRHQLREYSAISGFL